MAVALSSCAPAEPGRISRGIGQSVRSATQKAPPGAARGTCWDTEISPAVIETVTQQELVTAARYDSAGHITHPATFRTRTRQEVVKPRTETWFETLCPADFSPDLVATLQRALTVRGYHTGEITGHLDPATRAAIVAFQKAQGLESQTLSLENARRLGLISIKR